ncbi:integral membrane protein dgcr2 idd [Pitangus sulphuratus]|nr:integral membrane protein dgcr2 idd [Pitangus sulphuratus]
MDFQPVALPVAVTQVQDPALDFVEPHAIGLSQIPLQNLPTLQQNMNLNPLGVVHKLTEGTLYPLVQISDKDIKQDLTYLTLTEPWGAPLVTGHQLDATPLTTPPWAQSSGQPFAQ